VTTAVKLAPELCSHKQGLIREINAAVDEIPAIHNDEVRDVLAGDFTTNEMTQARLGIAREKKRLLIERYREHVTAHGC
jgi:hypothetical protein